MKLTLHSLQYEITSDHVEMASRYKADIVCRMRSIDRDDRNIVSDLSDEDLIRSCWSTITDESDILDEEGVLCLIAVLMGDESSSKRLLKAIKNDIDQGVMLDVALNIPILYDPSAFCSVDILLDSSRIRFKVGLSKVALALSVMLASGRPDYRSHHSMVFFHAGRLSAFSKAPKLDESEESAKVLLMAHALLCQSADFTYDAVSEFFEFGSCELAIGRTPGEVTRLNSEMSLPSDCLISPTQKGIH